MMITVDTKELVKLTTQLATVHRAAFPNAVRFTLNDLAFDVKKNTLFPALNQSGMIIRSPQFFKRYSGVEKATGWDMNAMQSQVGMMPSLASGSNANKAVSRLEEQEKGGSLIRPFVPLENIRYGETARGRIRRKNFQGNIFIWRHIREGDKQGFIRAVTDSGINRGGTGRGIAVLYGKILYEIVGFKRLRESDSIILHVNKLYTYGRDRKVYVEPKRFMERSALQSGAKLQEFFNRNAERQLKKFMNR